MRSCPACQNNSTQKISVDVPFFRHINFTTCKQSIKLIKCTKCHTISNPGALKIEISTYKSKKYAESHQTEQTKIVHGFNVPVTRSVLQAKILKERFIKSKIKPRILDIGCFDGRMLLELDSRTNFADLWGFDINPHVENIFPHKDNFHFVKDNLQDLEVGSFDMITLSHSIMYIPSFNELIDSISYLLKNDGIFFIQIPDILKNPYGTLMGDQHFIFTEKSLRNILSKFGFRSNVIINNYFPSELLIAAQFNEVSDLSRFEKDNTFKKNINKLNIVKKNLENLDDREYTVLGTTVNAAFVDEIIGNKIKYFVDEDRSKVGNIFRGKKIIDPRDLKAKYQTLLPFGNMSENIHERFIKKYKGNFLKV